MNITSKNYTPVNLKSAVALPAPPLLVDVREYPEFAGGHLAGSRLISLAQLETRAQELPKDREIVLICRTGRRSAEAAEKLGRRGFDKLGQLEGGVMSWQKAGLPLEREAHAPWAIERQVRLVAGLLIVLGLALSYLWPWAILLSWFVPLGLIFAALTDSCAMGMMIAKMPWNRRPEASGSLKESRA